MKATGIVRRIDDLGRVVVPKEIRRTLRIREGDPLEIFTDKEGEIILKKYSPSRRIIGIRQTVCRKACRRCWDVWQESVIWIRWSQRQERKKELQDEDITRELGEFSEGKKDAECKSRRKTCARGEQNRTLQSGGDQSDPVCGGCDRGGTPAEHGSERPV